jgi:hypothetical protein
MSSVIELIGEKTFEEVKVLSGEYLLNVKEDGDLYMLSFTKESNVDEKFVRESNGIILEKGTNKVVHHCFSKSYDGIWDGSYFKNCMLEGNTYNCEDIEKVDYEVEHYTEGSLIRVYWYNGKWNTGSSRKINAAFSHWGGDKSLKEMFYEALKVEDIDLDLLDKNNCYSFLLQHPELKICLDTKSIFCIMINMVNLETLVETRTTDGYKVNSKISDLVDTQNRIDKNYFVYLPNGERIKMISEEYKKIQKLLGNNPSMKFAYMESLQNGDDIDIKKHFPSMLEEFNFVDGRLLEVSYTIHALYMANNVRKENENVYHKYTRSLIQLHAIYRKHRQPITREKVMTLLMTLKSKTLYWVLDL